MGCQRIKNLVSELREVLAIAKFHRRGAGECRKRNHLLPALKTEKYEILFLADWPTYHTAELVLIVESFQKSLGVVLKRIGVKQAVTPVIEHVAMPFFGARF